MPASKPTALRRHEAEIVRIELDSTTYDVISLRVRLRSLI
jgi:hypothetical protein